MALIDIQVPDIGDFKDVAVIEVLVKPGDTIKTEQSLITVESDKASMEIPSSAAGVVKELKVKIGDTVALGSVVLTLETGAAQAPVPAAAPLTPAAAPAAPSSAPAPAAASHAGGADCNARPLTVRPDRSPGETAGSTLVTNPCSAFTWRPNPPFIARPSNCRMSTAACTRS